MNPDQMKSMAFFEKTTATVSSVDSKNKIKPHHLKKVVDR